MTWLHPAEKLRQLKKMSGATHRGMVWVVAYVNQRNSPSGPSRGISVATLVKEALDDARAAFGGGADGVVLIDEWADRSELEACVGAVRREFPDRALGVNYLGDAADPYGYRGAFAIAQANRLQWVWTDFSGVDLIEEQAEVSLHAIETERQARFPDGFYCSGIHMKYSTLRNPQKSLEQSALQAMGFVDGIVVTGLKTGMPTDPAAVLKVRTVATHYPVGVASGVSAANVGHLLQAGAEFFLVASSLQDEHKRIRQDKVSELIAAMAR